MYPRLSFVAVIVSSPGKCCLPAAALEPLEKQWGGTLAERNARQLEAFKTASVTGA